MFRPDDGVSAGNSESLHHVVQFPHIAGPVVLSEDRQRCGTQSLNTMSMIPASCSSPPSRVSDA